MNNLKIYNQFHRSFIDRDPENEFNEIIETSINFFS